MEETSDKSFIVMYVTASIYSVFLDRKHKPILAPKDTDRKSDMLS